MQQMNVMVVYAVSLLVCCVFWSVDKHACKIMQGCHSMSFVQHHYWESTNKQVSELSPEKLTNSCNNSVYECDKLPVQESTAARRSRYCLRWVRTSSKLRLSWPMRVRKMRLSTSICFSPMPLTRPPACLSKCVHMRVRRGSWYSLCASSTCKHHTLHLKQPHAPGSQRAPDGLLLTCVCYLFTACICLCVSTHALGSQSSVKQCTKAPLCG